LSIGKYLLRSIAVRYSLICRRFEMSKISNLVNDKRSRKIKSPVGGFNFRKFFSKVARLQTAPGGFHQVPMTDSA
jgi:hypothetical protein